jgi:GAF domain-containing protein
MASPVAGEVPPQRTETAALLEVARLVARDAPPEELFAAAAEQAARLLGVEAASVMRFLGEGRAVVVGVWRAGGTRSMPVNAELDFDRRNSALGRAWTAREPARAATYEGVSGELPVIMRASGLRSSVAAPVLRHDDVWGALVASTTRDEPIAAEAERWLAEIAALVAQAVANQDARRGLEASRLRLVEAADDARRRLERVLHEGAQQHVLSLTLKLKLARGRAPAGSELAAAIDDALLETMEADAALRDLARALYPAALAERGLGAALQGLVGGGGGAAGL